MSRLRVFEAFSGVGSQRMALRNIGVDHEVVAISEIDKFAIQSYEAIHGKTNNIGDISKLSVDDIPDHDLFTYSFPCQDISIAGRQDGLSEGSGTRSSLLWECRRVIEGKKPKYLLLENVKNLVGKKNKADFDLWLEWLSFQGYVNYWQVLNAKDYGIPQNRERVFVVSILGDENYQFPEKQELKLRLKDVLESEVNEKYFLKDELIERLVFNGKTIGHIGDINQKGWTDVIKRVYNEEGLSPSLTTMQGGYREPKLLVDHRIRKFTPLECWSIMGFTIEDYQKAKNSGLSDSQLYKQAGNSIVVQVLEGIFSQLFKPVKVEELV